jgi:hypothetical protein
MLKKIIKITSLIFFSICITIAIPQFIYDPLGVRLWDDYCKIVSSFQCANDDCSLYKMPTGVTQFDTGWEVTTNEHGFRVTPANSPTCEARIALIGDSFIWGPMVNDDETWANLLALQFGDRACFDIYAQWGYNAEQALWSLEQQVPADTDYVLYFVFQNDNYAPYPIHQPQDHPSFLYLMRYGKLVGLSLGWMESNNKWRRIRVFISWDSRMNC